MRDIGEMLAQDQMEEYRQAHAALARGERLPRLTWAAHGAVAAMVAGLVFWLGWSLAR